MLFLDQWLNIVFGTLTAAAQPAPAPVAAPTHAELVAQSIKLIRGFDADHGTGVAIFTHDKRGFVAVRTHGIGDQSGNDDDTLAADGYLIDIMAGCQLGKVDVNLTVNNATDPAWWEGQFADTSRGLPTAPLLEQIHFAPGVPLTATVTAAYRF